MENHFFQIIKSIIPFLLSVLKKHPNYVLSTFLVFSLMANVFFVLKNTISETNSNVIELQEKKSDTKEAQLLAEAIIAEKAFKADSTKSLEYIKAIDTLFKFHKANSNSN